MSKSKNTNTRKSSLKKVEKSMKDNYNQLYASVLDYMTEFFRHWKYESIKVSPVLVTNTCDSIIIGIYSNMNILKYKPIMENLTSIISRYSEAPQTLEGKLVSLSTIDVDENGKYIFDRITDEYVGVMQVISNMAELHVSVHKRISWPKTSIMDECYDTITEQYSLIKSRRAWMIREAQYKEFISEIAKESMKQHGYTFMDYGKNMLTGNKVGTNHGIYSKGTRYIQ